MQVSTTESPVQHVKVVGLRKLLPWIPKLLLNPLPSVVDMVRKEGGMLYFDALPDQQLLMISDPRWAKYVLKDAEDHFSRRAAIQALSEFLGDGIFRSEGALWHQMHSVLKPAFHEKQVAQYFSVMQQETRLLIQKIKNKTQGGQLVNVEPLISHLLLNLLLKTQFCNSIEYPINEIIQLQSEILKANSIISIKKHWLINTIKTKLPGIQPRWKRHQPGIKALEAIINQIRHAAKGNRGFILEQLEMLAEKGAITDRQVRDEMMNFIFAGYDTTAAALSWSLVAAADYPAALEPVLAEIAAIETDIPTPGELSKMVQLKYFVQESLRLFPPVWALFRVSNTTTTFHNFELKKGGYVMINVFGIHHSASTWGDPEEFRPARFMPEEFRGKSFAYLPFGHGSRICIGKPMAMTECQLILCLLLKAGKWSRESPEAIPVESGIIRKSKKGIWMKFQPFH